MEKIENRNKYMETLSEFSKKVELNDEFIDLLKSHRYFSDGMKSVMNFPDEATRKIFILLEFTKSRSTCEAVIELLRNSGQTEAAYELQKYNTSPGRMPITTNDEIIVNIGKEMRGSLYYSMSKNPRGKCVIINNLVKYYGNLIENTLLYKESKRFQNIFTQLYFDIEPIDSTIGMTAKAIKERLQLLSKDNSLFKHDALVVMIISHGTDEKVLGYNACQGKDDNDVIKISEIVQIFSESNCPTLRNKPKLFFFNCCRNKEEFVKPEYEINHTLKENENRGLLKLNTIDQTWSNANRDTFICYSCSEGPKQFYDGNLGISHFGQALSHSIAQYACEESLQSIISRTCDLMENLNSKSLPELRGLGLRRQLFFNPGFYK